MTASSLEHRLVFLVSAPRSGSTLLMRILAATSQIGSRPEPHLLPPIAHLGLWDSVDAAPYDHIRAQQAIRALAADLPDGERAMTEACRAYADNIYGRLLEGTAKRYFLDKTPENALVLPFVRRLYPNARYVVLTRHPAAVLSSQAHAFFDGDYEAARRRSPILSRYVPAIARFLRDPPARLVHLRYEDLVADPEAALRRVSDLLDIPFEPAAVEYGACPLPGHGPGDPLGVDDHRRPVTGSVDRWAVELARDTERLAWVGERISALDPRDLETCGYPIETLWEPLNRADPSATLPRRRWDRHALLRRALVLLRRDIHDRPLGRAARHIRLACDVLLRG